MSPDSDFSVILWSRPEDAPRSEWAGRCTALLDAIRSASSVRRFVIYDEQRIAHDVAVEPAAIERLIVREGEASPELGTPFTIICTDGSDPERSWHWRLGITIGLAATEPGLGGNNVVLGLSPGTSPDVARAVFEACVPPWSPGWACVSSAGNRATRREHDQPEGGWPPPRLDRLLHWCTYFGPERAHDLDVERLAALAQVDVRPLHDGVEVVLGAWESDEALIARQREAEALITPGRDDLRDRLRRGLRGRG